jgi:hypothetical protein
MAWGQRLVETLEIIDRKFVIMLFDDFILEDNVRVDKIVDSLNQLKANPDISVFYFNNIPGKNIADGKFPEFELIGKRNDYRLNSAPAIWRKRDLISYTGTIDSPWAWEVFGSFRTYVSPSRFYCAKRENEDTFVYNYALGGAIRRGKWVASVVTPLLKKYEIKIDLNKRGIASESLSEGKYSLKWKINFFILGFKMVGWRAFIFFFRAIKKKITKS